MNDFDDEVLDEFDEAVATIRMVDDDGNETEFVIISSVSDNDTNYLLVSVNGQDNDDEAEAVILKEAQMEGADSIFVVVEDEEEFLKAVALFRNSNDDYVIEI